MRGDKSEEDDGQGEKKVNHIMFDLDQLRTDQLFLTERILEELLSHVSDPDLRAAAIAELEPLMFEILVTYTDCAAEEIIETENLNIVLLPYPGKDKMPYPEDLLNLFFTWLGKYIGEVPLLGTLMCGVLKVNREEIRAWQKWKNE